VAELLPPALTKLIEALGNLPGVGPRTAERYAYFLVRRDPAKSDQLAAALSNLHAGVAYCPKTFALISSDDDVSPLYSDPRRDKKLVAVVAEPLDIVALEKTNGFHGTYHVLGGLVSPIDGIGDRPVKVTRLARGLPIGVDLEYADQITLSRALEGRQTL
jgi:recombination protein RecR